MKKDKSSSKKKKSKRERKTHASPTRMAKNGWAQAKGLNGQGMSEQDRISIFGKEKVKEDKSKKEKKERKKRNYDCRLSLRLG